MSNESQTLAYFSPNAGKCPLCNDRPLWKKKIYGHPVCKKCFYKFANRRQLDYLLDSLIFAIPNFAIVYGVQFAMLRSGVPREVMYVISFIVGLALGSVFCLRDGFNGQSPGKRATDLIVLNEVDYRPISFGQSFKRNCVLLLSAVPIVGGLIALVLIIVIALQVGSGYRLGDRFAKTKVIWRKYAHLPVFGGTAALCTSCGYDLQGNISGVCPECGTSIPVELQSRLITTRAIASRSFRDAIY